MEPTEIRRLSAFYADRVDSHDILQPGHKRAWGTLTAVLLSRGGLLVVPPMKPEQDIDLILGNPQQWSGSTVLLVPGDDNACHANTASAWLFGDIESIGTGYALCDDQLWRQHTWGVTGEDVVVESTEPRQAYVGSLLKDDDALLFVASNIDAATFEDARLNPRGERGVARTAEMVNLVRESRAARGL